MLVIRRETVEVFECDEEQLKELFASEQGATTLGRLEVEDPEEFESWLIDKFERHTGSNYGNDLFSNIDFDNGYVIARREDD